MIPVIGLIVFATLAKKKKLVNMVVEEGKLNAKVFCQLFVVTTKKNEVSMRV